VAEHIPGCNMSFRVDALRAIGGFDPRYRTAGDDVDACWRLQDKGWTIGFHPGAVVWHHRRNSAKAFWRQQIGYGRAEALLEGKWPARYNPAGHLPWRGRIYGPGPTKALFLAQHVYHGPWGTAPFQGLYRSGPNALTALPLMPEWCLLIAALAAVGILGFSWPPLWWAMVAAIACFGVSVAQAFASARHALALRRRGRANDPRAVALAAYFHLQQPLARLRGRLKFGLTIWRRRGVGDFVWPWRRSFAVWCERWQAPEARIAALQRLLIEERAAVVAGGPFDRWDLELRAGLLGGARILLATEEHGAGRQNLVFRIAPFASRLAIAAAGGAALLSVLAAGDGAWVAAAAMGIAAVANAAAAMRGAGLATGAAVSAVRRMREEWSSR
jgi:hypothetical protein